MEAILYLLVTLLIINLTVTVHELGHLHSARKHGVRVTEFSLGAGKVLKQWTTKSGLVVSWRLFPTGGSVRPVGMTVEDVEEHKLPHEGTYIYASPWTRFRVTIAGIGYNFALGILAELILITFYINPQSWEDWTKIPSILFWSTLVIVGMFINVLVTAPLNGFKDVGSIITMPSGVTNTIQVADDKGIPLFITFLLIIMVISMFMGVMNMLPIYPLDGFYIATAIADMSRKSIHGKNYKPLSMNRLKPLVLAGYSTVVALMSYLVLRDILHLIT